MNHSLRSILITLTLITLATGCAKPAGVIFTPPATPILWPAAPESPRVLFIGQLTGSDDLKPAVPFLQGLGQTLFGKTPPHTLLTPYALCTDGKDRLFIADSAARVVHVFDLETRQYQRWTPQEDLKGFSLPVAVAWDPAGRLMVADSLAGCIFLFDTDGKPLGQIGHQIVTRPCGLAFDAKNARLLVADSASHQVHLLSRTGELIKSLGRRGSKPGEFNFPTNLALDSQGRLYVSDSLNFRVQQFSPDLAFLRQIGRKGDMPGYFSQPKGLAVDSEDHLYAIDANFEAVQIFDSNGVLLMDFGQEGSQPGEFWLPTGIFIDPQNRIWIADSYNRRVQVFEYLPEGKP